MACAARSLPPVRCRSAERVASSASPLATCRASEVRLRAWPALERTLRPGSSRSGPWRDCPDGELSEVRSGFWFMLDHRAELMPRRRPRPHSLVSRDEGRSSGGRVEPCSTISSDTRRAAREARTTVLVPPPACAHRVLHRRSPFARYRTLARKLMSYERVGAPLTGRRKPLVSTRDGEPRNELRAVRAMERSRRANSRTLSDVLRKAERLARRRHPPSLAPSAGAPADGAAFP